MKLVAALTLILLAIQATKILRAVGSKRISGTNGANVRRCAVLNVNFLF